MILSDYDLFGLGKTLIHPFDRAHVQPASIDVHLDRFFQVAQRTKFGHQMSPDLDNSHMFEELEIRPSGYMLMQPGDFVLASTFERVTIPANMVARFEGKSSLARLGLLVHITAGFIDPGFCGHITLEIKNLMPAPWRLEPGIKIGQLCFETMTISAIRPYGREENGSHYQNAERGPTLSRSHTNFSKINVFGGN